VIHAGQRRHQGIGRAFPGVAAAPKASIEKSPRTRHVFERAFNVVTALGRPSRGRRAASAGPHARMTCVSVLLRRIFFQKRWIAVKACNDASEFLKTASRIRTSGRAWAVFGGVWRMTCRVNKTASFSSAFNQGLETRVAIESETSRSESTRP